MSKNFYNCAACPNNPPQGFNKPPTLHTMCCHCHRFDRTWAVVSPLENQMWLQKRSFVTSVLGGTWTAPANTLPAPHAAISANLYNGKHFDKNRDKGAAKYAVTALQVNTMEAYAIEHGLDTPGAYIFLFSTQVGSDGSTFNDFTVNTRAIRVDSVGTAGQHSHPIAEDRNGAVNHKTLVCKEIVRARNNSDLFRYLKIATYLKTIGATADEYRLNAAERALLAPAADARACCYWS